MRLPVLTPELAHRLERAEAHALCSRLTAIAERPGNPMAVTIRTFGSATALQIKGIPGPTYNTVLGLGPEDAAQLGEIVSFYNEATIPCQIEVTPANTSPDFLYEVREHGFGPRKFHSTLYGVPSRDPLPLPEGVTIRPLRREEFDLYGDIYVQGFGMPQTLQSGVAANNQILYNRPGWHFYLAFVDEEPAAIGVLFMQDGVGICIGAATRPLMRGRGCQTALLHHRLQVAAEHGCDLVAASATFGSTSMQNMQRTGLQLAYTKTNWVRPVSPA